VTGEQPSCVGVMVRSQIIRANGEPVRVDYMMRQSGDAWLIADIYLDGAISEVAGCSLFFGSPSHRKSRISAADDLSR
jgi:hypothetical protein